MNLKKQTTVIITCKDRLSSIEEIVRAWCSMIDKVVLCDCSDNGIERFKDFNYSHYRFYPDPGNKVMHAAASMATTDYIIFADDDVIPLEGLIEDFEKWKKVLKNSFIGVYGRYYEGEDYYKNTVPFRADRIDLHILVDFASIIVLFDQQHAGINLKHVENNIVEIYHQNICCSQVGKFVIPTKNYKDLPECKTGLYSDHAERDKRNQFYKKHIWYNMVNRNV